MFGFASDPVDKITMTCQFFYTDKMQKHHCILVHAIKTAHP